MLAMPWVEAGLGGDVWFLGRCGWLLIRGDLSTPFPRPPPEAGSLQVGFLDPSLPRPKPDLPSQTSLEPHFASKHGCELMLESVY